jgi:YidC/Oxa1 family membrane protein insertase
MAQTGLLIDMTNQLRYFLWLGLLVLLWFNYTTWTAQFAAEPQSSAALRAASRAPALSNTIPQTSAPPASTATSAAPSPAKPVTRVSPVPLATPKIVLGAAPVIHVHTDVYDLEISTEGGTLVKVDLRRYAKVQGERARVQLENTVPATQYLLQTGLTGNPATNYPTQSARFTAPQLDYRMGAASELRVPLTWRHDGVTVTKTFVFHKDSYRIGLHYLVANHSGAPWTFAPYAQLFRNDPRTKGSYFHPTSNAYHGPAIWDGHKYVELNPASHKYQHFEQQVTDGWIAVPQLDFVSAVVPPAGAPYRITSQVSGSDYLLAATGPDHTVPPGATQSLRQTLFVGPTLHGQLEKTDPTLTYLDNYGFFTLLARPLFWLLSRVHGITGNWGVAIIVVTILLKLLFYPLSEASGRSMAKMKALAPRIKTIQETYKDDKEKLGRAMMEIYKREKVNPVAGCLPMLLQLPVFIAFYWVLLYSVELRQAPFIFWIHNLSARDPYFILPAIMAGTGYLQFKLNPAPPDPIQAKMMMIMPLIMAGLFAFFPSGLVLYYVVNSLLSIAQQWHINRRIVAATNRRT